MVGCEGSSSAGDGSRNPTVLTSELKDFQLFGSDMVDTMRYNLKSNLSFIIRTD